MTVFVEKCSGALTEMVYCTSFLEGSLVQLTVVAMQLVVGTGLSVGLHKIIQLLKIQFGNYLPCLDFFLATVMCYLGVAVTIKKTLNNSLDRAPHIVS